jgi:hypothetical protein
MEGVMAYFLNIICIMASGKPVRIPGLWAEIETHDH